MNVGCWIQNRLTKAVDRIAKIELEPSTSLLPGGLTATLLSGSRVEYDRLAEEWVVVEVSPKPKFSIKANPNLHPALEELDTSYFRRIMEEGDQLIRDHIERFAAAYVQLTNIKPDEAIMNISRGLSLDGSLITRIWFERKNDDY